MLIIPFKYCIVSKDGNISFDIYLMYLNVTDISVNIFVKILMK